MTWTLSRKVLAIVVAFALSGSLGFAFTGSASAQPPPRNTNPVDWTVLAFYTSALGHVVPMRVGQHDLRTQAGVVDGFGRVHIIDGHGIVPADRVIIDALAAACAPSGFNRILCKSDEAEVVYDTGRDPRSSDAHIVGIMTAYFRNPCVC